MGSSRLNLVEHVNVSCMRPCLLALALAVCVCGIHGQDAVGISGSSIGTIVYMEGFGLTDGSGPLYTPTATIFDAIKSWQSSNFKVLTASDPQRTGKTLSYVRFSAPAGKATAINSRRKRTATITCEVHAREMIGGELCFQFLRLLGGDPATLMQWAELRSALRAAGLINATDANSPRRAGKAVAARLRRLSQLVTTRIFPVVNVLGRQEIENFGNFTLRKTPDTQVDINRNFPKSWWTANSDPESMTYRGPYTGSEYQTRIMMKFMEGADTFVDVHSGAWAILSPTGFDCDMTELRAADIPYHQALIDAVNAPMPKGGIVAGPSGPLLSPVGGAADDAAYTLYSVRLVLTAEVYNIYGDQQGVTCPPIMDFKEKCGPDDSSGTCYQACEQLACVPIGSAVSSSSTSNPVSATSAGGSASELVTVSGLQLPAGSPGAAAWAIYLHQEGVEVDPALLAIPATAVSAEITEDNAPAGNEGAQPGVPQPWWPRDPFLRHLAASNDDAQFFFRMFNPETPEQFRDTVGRWIAALIVMLEETARLPQ